MVDAATQNGTVPSCVANGRADSDHDCKTAKPNALVVWKDIAEMLKGQTLAIFLDYDGTLTPIVDNPDEAQISEDMRRIVERLSKKFTVALVTGRKIETIKEFMKLDSLYYAGSHGFDIRGPGDSSVKEVAAEYEPALRKVYQKLSQQIQAFDRALVENNKYSISVHYRNCEPSLVPDIEKLVDSQIAEHPAMLVKTHGKMVFEIRPKLDWHKGRAVDYLLQTIFGEQRSKVFPIYLGDDRTDEDAFAVLKDSGTGLGVHIQYIEKPAPTSASYILYSTEEVKRFLQHLCAL